MKEASIIIALNIEYQKLKRTHTRHILLVVVVAQILWLWVLMSSGSSDNLEVGYISCLYQFPQLNALLFPVMIGVLTSNLCNIEHKESTFKQLFTMQDSKQVFDAKFIVATSSVLLAFVLQISFIYLMGEILNFGDVFF